MRDESKMRGRRERRRAAYIRGFRSQIRTAAVSSTSLLSRAGELCSHLLSGAREHGDVVHASSALHKRAWPDLPSKSGQSRPYLERAMPVWDARRPPSLWPSMKQKFSSSSAGCDTPGDG